MQIEALLKLRPCVYHTTAAQNLDRIRRIRTIESARLLIVRAGGDADPRIRERRRDALPITVDGQPIVVRDQSPLIPASIAFEAGWDLARFVEYLNGFTFFWPGNAAGPIASGLAHFGRYAAAGERLAVLRVTTRSLLDHNRERALRFTRVNSGSARHHGGKPVPRGGATFMTAEAFAEPPGSVKEIVVADFAALPPIVEVAERPDGLWRPL